MEGTTFTIPVLENGVSSIGDLWNCYSSTPLGLNLFGNKFTDLTHKLISINSDLSQDEISLFHAKNSEEYHSKLGIGAEVSLELLGGIVKIAGGLDFEIEDSNGSGSEQIIWKWKRTSLTAGLLNADEAKDCIDPEIKSLLTEAPGHLRATHVVTKVDLGGNAIGSLRVTQSNTSNKYTVGLEIEGGINLFVASAVLKASAEVSEQVKTSNYNKEITLSSVPPLPPPTEPDEFLSLQDKFAEAYKLEEHFYNDSCSQILGIPILFVLTPVSRFLDSSLRMPIYRSIQQLESSENIIKMLLNLRDLRAKEFLSKMILNERPIAYKLLTDKNHAIARKVQQEEDSLVRIAGEFYNETVDAYMEFKKNPEEGEKLIKEILARYNSCNFMLKDKIQESIVKPLIEEANKELCAVKIYISDSLEEDNTTDVVREKRPLKLFTNPQEFQTWLQTENIFKIYYQTAIGVTTNGIPKRLYDMSTEIGKLNIGTGVLYPSVQGTTKEILKLDLRGNDRVYTFEEDVDMGFFTTVLEASLGLAQNGTTRLFSVYAELLGINFPLTKNAEYLYILYEFLKSKLENVKICDSINSTIEAIRDPEISEKLCIFFNLDGLNSITDIINSLPYLASISSTNTNIQWIVGTLEMSGEYDDSPILFLCHEIQVKGICLDHLDLIILTNLLEKYPNQTEFDLLSRDQYKLNPLSERRLEHADKVINIIEGTRKVVAVEDKITKNNPEYKRGNETSNVEIKNVLLLTCSLLRNQSQLAVNFISALVQILCTIDSTIVGQIPYFSDGLLDIDLSSSDKWLEFQQSIEKTINDKSCHLETLKEVKNTLQSFLQESESSVIIPLEEDAADMSPENIVNESIQKLYIFAGAEKPTNEQINIWNNELMILRKTSLPVILKCSSAMVYLELIENIFIKDHEEVNFYLFRIFDIAKQINDNQSISINTRENILGLCLDRIPWNKLPDYKDNASTISFFFKQKQYYSLVRILSSCLDNKYLLSFHRTVRKFSSIENWQGIVELLEVMHKREFTQEILTYIWKNPKFLYIMEYNKKNMSILTTIQTLFCKEGIPGYLPSFIVEALNASMVKSFTWIQSWPKIDIFIHCLQILYVRGVVPNEFSEVLLSNVLLYPEVYSELKSNILKFWNQEGEYFEEPWDLSIMIEVINKVLLLSSHSESHSFDTLQKFNPPLQFAIGEKSTPEHRISTKSYYEIKSLFKPPSSTKDMLTNVLEMIKMGISIEDIAVHFHSNRIDILSVLFSNTTDHVLIQEILRIYVRNETQIAIPMILQNSNERNNYYCFNNLLQNLQVSFDDFFSALSPPYHLITAIRISDHFLGKSTLLNQFLLKNKGSFQSKNFQQQIIKPTCLDGCVEIISLTEENCEARFWNEVLQKGIKDFSVPPKQILLANLHGDALKQPEDILRILGKISSSFLIFWMPQSFQQLRKNKEYLGQIIGSLKTSYDLCIDPTDKKLIENAPNEIIIPQPFMDSKNYDKMYTALLRALRPNSNVQYEKLSPTFKTVQIHPGIGNTTEGTEFIDFIKAKRVRNIKKYLVLQQKDLCTAEELKEIWDNSPDYAKIFKLLYSVFNIGNTASREGTLAHITQSLNILSNEMSIPFYEKLKFLHDKYRVETDPLQTKNIKSQIRMIRRDIRKNSLSLKDLFNEMSKIYLLKPELLSSNEGQRKSFPQIYSELIENGSVVTVPSSSEKYFPEDCIIEALGNFIDEYPGLRRLFVLSIIGTEEDLEQKVDLLNNIFGKPEINLQEMLLQEGLSLRLLKLSDELQNKLHFDGILLLQSDCLVQLHLSNSKEIELHQRLLPLIMSISHFTIISTSVLTDFELIVQNLGTALLSMLRTSPQSQILVPDILFANFTGIEIDEHQLNILVNSINKLTNSQTGFPFETGIQSDFSAICWKIIHSIENNGILFNVNFNFESNSELMSLILEKAKLQSENCLTIHSWANLLQTTWHNLRQDTFSFGSNKSLNSIQRSIDINEAIESFCKNLDKAFLQHHKSNDFFSNFSEALTQFKEDYDFETLESKKNQIINDITDNISSVYEACKMGEAESSCAFCQNATIQMGEIEETFSNTEEIINDIKQNIKVYIGNFKQSAIQMVQQMMVALELELTKARKIQSSVEFTPIQVCSLGIKVIPGTRQLISEVKTLYAHIIRGGFDMLQFINKISGDPNFNLMKTFEAFDDEGLSVIPLEEKYLDWKTSIKLLNNLLSIPKSIFTDRNASIYQPGMIRSLRDEINGILEDTKGQLTGENLSLSHEFRYMIHAYGIGIFNEHVKLVEESWDLKYNPLKLVSQN